MNRLLCLLLLFSYTTCMAQSVDTLELTACYQIAKNKLPILKTSALQDQLTMSKISNLNTSYLPQLTLNGQATYQSAVTEIPPISPMFVSPTISKDQYKLYLELNQIVWDGGITGYQKDLEKKSLAIEQQNIVVELTKVIEKINQLFFSILISESIEKVLKTAQLDLENRQRKIMAGVNYGIQLQYAANTIAAEILKIQQQRTENDFAKINAIKILEIYLDTTISPVCTFTISNRINISTSLTNNRPEMKIFDLQSDKLNTSYKLSQRKLMPKVSAFGQGGYGRPTFNMLNNDFDFFYIFGVRASWNISAFYQTKNDKSMIETQQKILLSQKETLDKNIAISSQKDLSDIQKYTQLLQTDDSIINLKHKITHASEVQFENGVLTATEYLTDLYAETQARLNKEMHAIQLFFAKTNYSYITGNIK